MTRRAFERGAIRTLWAVLFTGICLSLHGCSYFPLRVEICGPPGLNRNLPLTLMARATDRIEHQEETYNAAARRMSQPDPSRLWAGSLRANWQDGMRRRFSITVPKQKALGLYFLFAEPYGSWKVLFEPPIVGTVRIELGQQGVQRATR